MISSLHHWFYFMTAFELPPPIVDVEVMVPTLEVSVCSVVLHLSIHVT